MRVRVRFKTNGVGDDCLRRELRKHSPRAVNATQGASERVWSGHFAYTAEFLADFRHFVFPTGQWKLDVLKWTNEMAEGLHGESRKNSLRADLQPAWNGKATTWKNERRSYLQRVAVFCFIIKIFLKKLQKSGTSWTRLVYVYQLFA